MRAIGDFIAAAIEFELMGRESAGHITIRLPVTKMGITMAIFDALIPHGSGLCDYSKMTINGEVLKIRALRVRGVGTHPDRIVADVDLEILSREPLPEWATNQADF